LSARLLAALLVLAAGPASGRCALPS